MKDTTSNPPQKGQKEIPKQGKKKQPSKPIKMANLRFEFLTEARAEQAAHLFTQSFIQFNTMWKQLGATYGQVFSVNRGRMIACCKAGWTCVMIDTPKNQIVAVAPGIDLVDYIDTQSMPNSSLFLKVLGKYATELQKQHFEKLRPTLKRGDVQVKDVMVAFLQVIEFGIRVLGNF